jgi:hypothetical protein
MRLLLLAHPARLKNSNGEGVLVKLTKALACSAPCGSLRPFLAAGAASRSAERNPQW